MTRDTLCFLIAHWPRTHKLLVLILRIYSGGFMRTAWLLAALALAGTTVQAQRLSTGNVIALAASSAAIVGDCVSTSVALHRSANVVENNAFLGSRPSAGRLVSVCGAGLLLNGVGLGWLLRGNERTWGWGIVAGIETIHTAHNVFEVGVQTSF